MACDTRAEHFHGVDIELQSETLNANMACPAVGFEVEFHSRLLVTSLTVLFTISVASASTQKTAQRSGIPLCDLFPRLTSACKFQRPQGMAGIF